MSVVVEEYRPCLKGTLRGFIRVRHDSGMIVDQIAVHVGGNDGHAWLLPPGKPMVDANGVAIRNERTGKVRYTGLVSFANPTIKQRWENEVLQALERQFPEALDDEAA